MAKHLCMMLQKMGMPTLQSCSSRQAQISTRLINKPTLPFMRLQTKGTSILRNSSSRQAQILPYKTQMDSVHYKKQVSTHTQRLWICLSNPGRMSTKQMTEATLLYIGPFQAASTKA